MQELGAQPYKDKADDTLRCPDCWGLNPIDADWCGQCLRSFSPPQPPPPPPQETAEAPPLTTESDPLFGPLPSSAPGSPTGPAGDGFDPLSDPLGIGFGSVDTIEPSQRVSEGVEPAAEPAREVKRHGAFAVAGRDISWTCDRCDTDNELAAQICRVCGSGFGDIVRPAPERIQRDPNTVALISLFFPGAGHAYLGMWSQAIARAAMSTWVLAVVLVASLQRGVPGAGAIVALFGVTAFALWGVAAHDAYREASDEPHAVVLRPRMFLYVTIALLFLLFTSLMIAGFGANR
jgi:ribosomal protein L40E